MHGGYVKEYAVYVDSWPDYVFQRTSTLTVLELQLLQLNEQPRDYAVIRKQYSRLVRRPDDVGNFESIDILKPDRWTYRDEEFPSWYCALE